MKIYEFRGLVQGSFLLRIGNFRIDFSGLCGVFVIENSLDYFPI